MSLELDKRIKAITDIKSVTDGCHDWELMTKKGYFANSIFDFKDLERTCVYGEYTEYREHDQCFLCEIDHYDGTFDHTYYRYFIPEDVLKPEEPKKKYRPLSYKEFWRLFDFGDGVCFRRKGQDTAEFSMYLGYEIDSDGNRDEIPGEGKVNLGGNRYTLAELFEYYEMQLDDEWQPFGVEEKE